MIHEYLLFNLGVIAGPFACAQYPPTSFRGRWRAALAAAAVVAAPFLVWDALVTGRHWWFNDAYTAWFLAGLPLGEWLFFFSVPLACAYTWEMLTGGVDDAPARGAAAGWLVAAGCAAGGAVAWIRGLEYTGAAGIALAAALVVDLSAGKCVVRHRRFVPFAVLVLAFTTVFNGYLTARPLVLYDARYQLDLRAGTIPIEDFVYGLALVLANVTLFERWRDRLGAPRTPLGDTVGRRVVRHFFGGYRQQVNVVRADAPERLATPRRVAVVGAGLAGLRAATLLGARGFDVHVFEREEHLGGKVGAWPRALADGTPAEAEHGFHAFFRHYYNARRFMDEIGASAHWRGIDDYQILGRDGEAYGFRDLETAPVLNALAMLRTPMLRPRDLLLRPRMARLAALLAYDPARTFGRYDGMSFDDFAARADLPPALRLVFYSFARAFFATPDHMSAAEVVKSFHFFYLSHDHGLLYDFPTDTYGRTVLAPLRARLDAVGATVHVGADVGAIGTGAGGFRVRGEPFDYVVLAADVTGARAIAEASPELRRAAPDAMAKVAALVPSQPNAVLRLWLDRDAGRELPEFVITDKRQLLDSVTFVHRVEDTWAAWARRTGGGVYELHCYAVPDGTPDAEIGAILRDELWAYFPALQGARVLDEHLAVRRNFTAFHVGMRAGRPGVTTDDPRLVLAGDWVALDVPAMLMEGAVTAGIEAANAICRREGVREEPVFSVPLRGLLAGFPCRGSTRGRRLRGLPDRNG